MNRKGFTLIELLIIIAIIGFLAAAILVAVDPVRRIQDSRDARRSSEANAVLNAILTKQVDDRGIFAGDNDGVGTDHPIITDTDGTGGYEGAQVIVRTGVGVTCDDPATRPGCRIPLNVDTTTSCIADLDEDNADYSIVPEYIAELPIDPRGDGVDMPCGNGTTCAASGTEGELPLGDNNTGYYIWRTDGNRIEIGSCAPEQATEIRVKR